MDGHGNNHELERYLPRSWRAGGLNHFSVLLQASYADTGSDACPDIMAKAPTVPPRYSASAAT